MLGLAIIMFPGMKAAGLAWPSSGWIACTITLSALLV